MADFFTNYAQPQQRTSLADMVNTAQGIQSYQQAQQLNPLQVQAAQANLQSAQQEAQKGGIQLQQLQQANQERIAIQNLISKNPDALLTDGRFDIDKLNKEIPKLAPMTADQYIDRFSKLSDAQSKAEESKTKLNEDRRNIIGSNISALGYAGIDDPSQYINSLQNLKKLYKSDNAFQQLADSHIEQFKLAAKGDSVTKMAVQLGNSLIPSSDQAEKFAQKAQYNDVGGQKVLQIYQPSVGGNPPSITSTGEVLGKTLPPTVFANPITGQPTVLGGGNPNVNRSVSNPSYPSLPANSIGNQPNANQFGGGGQLGQQPNESPSNFNARVAQTQGLYSSALDQYNNPNSAAGHIPTAQNLNNNILNLLKDPQVKTGSIADYLANKTNKGALNAKEQELTKYLEQRIQGLSPRSDADAVSMKNAFGSFNLDKEALKDIVRNDNAFVTSRDLLAKGILHNGTNPLNPTNPNYGNVSNFVNRFTPYSSDPTLMKYISIVGEKPKVKVDDDDRKALAKVIGDLSLEERTALETKRQQLLRLVNPGSQ